MHDLRRQVLLESGKTVSRKARSKQGTPGSSRAASAATSPRTSRVPSANASDDEDTYSESTQWSSHSIDELITFDSDIPEEAQTAWAAELGDRINEICDRKRSSVQGREESLTGFVTALTRHFSQGEIGSKLDELVGMLLKSVKAGASEKETILALKALAMILITSPSEHVYEAVAGPFKTVATDSQDAVVKVAAIHAMGVSTFYGGASGGETEDTMDFLLAIASSDGATVEAADNPDVVTAALEEWGFLATQLDDVEEVTEEAMDVCVEQLDSSSVDVQIAAGDNIALLYEKSYTEAESDDEDNDDSDEATADGDRMVKRYTVYRQKHQLQQRLEELSKASSKRLSKKDKKSLHMVFTDILNTVERPTRGPRYSTALDEDGRERGSRLKIAIHGGGKMTIDTWWKLHRLNSLKRLLQGGFLVHYEHNQVVFDTLPVIIEDD